MIYSQADKHATKRNLGACNLRPMNPIVTESGLSSSRTARPPTEPLIRYAVLNLLRSSSAVLRVAIILAALLQSSSAAPVSFGFTGYIALANDPLKMVSGVEIGTPFTGTLTYDSALTRPPSDTPSPHTEYYNFTNAAGLTLVVQVGSHTFIGTAKTLGQAGIIIYDNYGEDSMEVWLNPSQTKQNGVTSSPEYTHGGVGIRLKDFTETAYTSDALPTTRPALNQFDYRQLWISLSKLGMPQEYTILGTITAFTDSFQPQLNIRRLPNGEVQLGWPLAATGFALESRAQLNSGNWEPVVQLAIATDTEYVVTLSTTQAHRFFRLAKTN
jgi:hypothetical protein